MTPVLFQFLAMYSYMNNLLYSKEWCHTDNKIIGIYMPVPYQVNKEGVILMRSCKGGRTYGQVCKLVGQQVVHQQVTERSVATYSSTLWQTANDLL